LYKFQILGKNLKLSAISDLSVNFQFLFKIQILNKNDKSVSFSSLSLSFLFFKKIKLTELILPVLKKND
jgi:hypothetical protein